MENESNTNELDPSPELEAEPQRNFDPKEVEAELLRQAEARAADPGESAAQAYQMYVPHFKRLLPSISTRGLRRVLAYMILYPLEQDSIKSANENEKAFMQLCAALVEAKFVLIMDSYNRHAEQLQAAKQAPLTREQEAEVMAELKAGGVSEEEIERLANQNKESTNG